MGVVDGYVAAFTPLRHDQNGADSFANLESLPPPPWTAIHE